MVVAPNGDVIVVRDNDGNAIEVTPAGKQTLATTLVKNGAGDLFDLAITPNDRSIRFVNDGTNELDLSPAEDAHLDWPPQTDS